MHAPQVVPNANALLVLPAAQANVAANEAGHEAANEAATQAAEQAANQAANEAAKVTVPDVQQLYASERKKSISVRT